MSEYHAIQFYTLYIKVGSTNLPNSIYSFGLLVVTRGSWYACHDIYFMYLHSLPQLCEQYEAFARTNKLIGTCIEHFIYVDS